jgi:hypothetical protein
VVLDTKARRDRLQQAAAMGERSQFSPSCLKMPTLVVLSRSVGRCADLQADGSFAEVQERVCLFKEARKLYRQRKWDAAQSAFRAILDRWSDDGPSLL